MNNKGLMRIVVAVWAYILWVVVIIAFVMLFNLKSDTIQQAGHTLQGNIGDGPEKSQELLAYLQTPISSCDINTQFLNINEDGDFYKQLTTNPQLTYAAMIEVGVNALDKKVNLKDMEEMLYADSAEDQLKNVERTTYLPYLKVWYYCTRKHLMNPGPTDTYSSAFKLSNADTKLIRENDFKIIVNGKVMISPDSSGSGIAAQSWQTVDGNNITMTMGKPPWQHDITRQN